MSVQLAAWLVGGGVIACLMALFVVILARGMEADRSKFSGASAAALAAALPGGVLGAMLKRRVLASLSDTDDKEAAVKAGKKAGRVAAAIVGASVAAAVGAAVASDAFEERDLRRMTPIELSAGELHGTLLSPRKNAPVVLIVPGSGPTDRDGNNPMGVRANVYKLLAEGLAQEGIASVRVDKRGMFGSASAGNPNDVSVEAYAADYRAWIDAIRAETGRKCVWLLGHSEGALMVSAAAEGRKDVCGLILVSGMGRKMGDIIRAQLQANPANAPLLGEAFAALDDLEAGRRTDTSHMHPALLPLFAPQVQDFLITVLATDPVDAVRRAGVKTLIVQGTTDLQVTEEDARLLNKAPRTRMEIIRGMNHILKEAPMERAANLATYTNPDLPLHPKLVREIEDFIKDD
ncbi:MAG TPA: alpha/beta fold hydrolase [Hyphomonadaceae bacterium]|nr:alpha/beta fold hydrolase [Hyphomonadaceae bacterium]